ncbi:hypothetical protein FH972_019933 [Carpinus fangiana]|uniref:Pentacotripeptide-repeat region of PRORP domain-containing protein n=1 Tax=Carpinus fangiana TaxID=176857 RepID=A0A5N6RRS2_9ROSI|nr:hypothetical protein FH972_019933 [Carpinus fangiana]
MMRRQFKPTAASYNPINALPCIEGKVVLVVKCLDQIICRRCTPNEGTYNVIAVLCEQGMVQEAFSIIQSLGNKQNSSMHDFYRSVLTGLCRKGNTYPAFQLLRMLDEAMEIFRLMEENNYRPDANNFNAHILGFCKSQRTNLSLEVFEMMIEKGYMPNETTYTIIMEGIAHENENQLAAKVLKELHLR